MFELIRIPGLLMLALHRASVGQRTEIMVRPETPCPTASLNRLDIVVYPSIRDRTAFVVDFEAFEYCV